MHHSSFHKINAEKIKDKKYSSLSIFMRLVPYVMVYPLFFWGALFFLFLGAFVTLSLPLSLRRIIDYDFIMDGSSFFLGHFWILIFLLCLLAISSAFRYYFITILGERVVCDLRKDVFSNLVSLSPEFFDRFTPGTIVSQLVADSVRIKSIVSSTSSFTLRNFVLGISSFIMMLVTSLKLSALVLGFIPLILLPLILFGRSVKNKSSLAQDALTHAIAYANERISDIRFIKAFTAESMIMDRFSSAIEQTFLTTRNLIGARSFLIFIAISMVSCSIVLVLWLASYDVRSGELSVGTMSQFILYAILGAVSLGSISEVWTELSQAADSVQRFIDILDQKPAIVSRQSISIVPKNVDNAIAFHDVTFSYPSRPDQLIVQGLNFSIQKGETVALVGASGSGKSTLFSLLLRFYDPQKGFISLHGIDLRDIDLFTLRHHIAFVAQDTILFSGSILENIALGNPKASLEEIQFAANASLVDEFVEGLPEGYHTLVGERGVSLSGGQRQRVAIARAILRNSPILLLDEATSSLDAQSEYSVECALQTLMEKRTTLVVTHKMARVLKADRILVIDQGDIIEEGTHAELLARKGVYANFVKIQFDSLKE